MSKKTRSTRRGAAFVAVLGLLLASTGAALLLSSGSASAAPDPKYFVCKYVGTPGEDERLQTGNNPISTASVPDPVVVGAFFNDAHGRSYVLAEDVGQPEPDVSECPPPDGGEDEEIAVDIVFVDPTCDNENTASYSLTGDTEDVTVEESTAPAPGVEVTVTATAEEGFTFADGDTYSETHTFTAAEDCTPEPPVVTPPVVEPPVVEPPAVEPPAATPTVVHAGLVGTQPDDLRSEQGIALLAAGLVLLMAAGGLARPRRVRR